jgi:hypothetical protein
VFFVLLLLKEWIANAPNTPIIVEIRADSKAISRVFKTMIKSLVSSNSSRYESRVKLSKSYMVPPLLNE